MRPGAAPCKENQNSMFLINTFIKKSSIAGIGVFAGENVKKGDIINTFVEGFDRRYTEEDLRALPPKASEYLRHYSYGGRDGYIYFPGDNDRFVNHSATPNTETLANGDVVALRDIRKGDEITCDYKDFQDAAWHDASWRAAAEKPAQKEPPRLRVGRRRVPAMAG